MKAFKFPRQKPGLHEARHFAEGEADPRYMRPFPPAAESVPTLARFKQERKSKEDGPLNSKTNLNQARQQEVAGRRVEQDAISGGYYKQSTIPTGGPSTSVKSSLRRFGPA